MKNQPNKLLVFILGPTAVGKTALTLSLAQKFNSEILSADSRQFYRELEIGTAKPSSQELNTVKHHFINSLSITDDYNVSKFEKDALKCIGDQFDNGDITFVVGGSGLYLHSIWHGFDDNLPGRDEDLRKELNELYNNQGIQPLIERLEKLDPEATKSIDLNNSVRIVRAIEINMLSKKTLAEIKVNSMKKRPFDQLKIGLNLDREILYDRINQRVDKMIDKGLLKEVQNLLEYKDKNALKTVGYQELFRYFEDEISLDEAIEKIKVNSRRFAKRQMTWFRRYSDIEWFEPGQENEIEKRIKEKLA